MEKTSMFQEVQAHTIECLNQIVVTNHNRQQEIKSWLGQAIHNGKMEYAMAVVENVPLENLSTVAKYCREIESREEIERRILGEAYRMSGLSDPILVTTDIAFIQEAEIEQKEQEGEGVFGFENGGNDDGGIIKDTKPETGTKKPSKSRARRVPVIVEQFTVDGCEFTLSVKRPTLAEQKKMDTEMQR
jgi:hypothetical protein